MEGMKEGQSECMTWRRKMASKKGSLNEIKAKASREEEKEGGELKERTFWPGGAAGKSGSVVCRAVGCALLVMELLAATQDKCPTYVESGESEREREREGEERELHCGNGYKCRE